MQFHREIEFPPEELVQSGIDMVEPEAPPAPPTQSLHGNATVQTPKGPKRLSTLAVGQKVLTRSGAFEPITQIDHVTFTNRQLHDVPEAAPVRFDPGALPGMPEEAPTLVSPDCPIAWSESTSELERFPARAFCDGGLIRAVIPDEGIHYIRLHFETRQQICVGGIWVELSPNHTEPKTVTHKVPNLGPDIRVFRPLYL